MSRSKLRRRTFLRIRRGQTRYYSLFLIIAFVAAFVSFSFTLYRNSTDLFDLIDYIFSFDTHGTIKYSVRSRIENYQSRDFLGKIQSLNYDYYIEYKDFDLRKPTSLTYRNRTYANKIEILYRFPQKKPLAALLLIFHACQHSASDWFHTPERQRIIGAAIDLGYGCLVFQDTENNSRCWASEADIYENKDVHMVYQGLQGFYQDYPELVSLPRFTFGSSSGGIFSSIFAINQKYTIQGQILFISIILPEVLYTHVKPKIYPPTVWIHMLRDVEFASEDRINISQQIFTAHHIPHRAFPIEPVALIHSTFQERIPSVSSDTSRFLLYQLQQNHWINTYDFLIFNPRRKLTWQTFLFPSSSPYNAEEMFHNLIDNQKLIVELLNTIYGEHEISFERSFEALLWLKETYLTSRNQIDWGR